MPATIITNGTTDPLAAAPRVALPDLAVRFAERAMRLRQLAVGPHRWQTIWPRWPLDVRVDEQGDGRSRRNLLVHPGSA